MNAIDNAITANLTANDELNAIAAMEPKAPC